MRQLPLAASLLALSIALAGCGEDKPAATASPQPAVTAAAVPATAVAGVSNEKAAPVVAHYADMAHAVFSDALSTALALKVATDALIATPNTETLAAARAAWKAARAPYMQSEVFRFGNAVVDDWEGQLNAWPLDEGLIDYVAADYQHALGNPGASANIIASQEIRIGEDRLDVRQLNGELLASLNELGGSEANVATGYHAIEFLLWGQDLNGTNPGAGNRPASDFAQGQACTGGHCDRRAAYLKASVELLVSDLEYMVGQWEAGKADNYRASLLAEDPANGLRKMLFGMGSLSLGELAGERMKVSLEANSTEDEHDCFSDNTHNAHYYNGLGVRNVYLGEYRRVDGSLLSGPSLSSLVAAMDAAADQKLRSDLDASKAALQALVDSAEKDGIHYDQLIAAGNSAGNQLVAAAIGALVTQTAAIETAAGKLGISDLNPDTADHAF